MKPLYFCTECRAVVKGAEKLLFVEENTSKGFCKESCIENFYSPIVQYFNHWENSLRKSLGVLEPELQDFLEEASFLNETLYRPDEIWKLENRFGESLYSYIKGINDGNNNKFYLIAICLNYNQRPSFIINNIVSRNEELKSKYQIGQRLSHQNGTINPLLSSLLEKKGIDGELKDKLNGKRGFLMKKLLTLRTKGDFDLESFPHFEKNLKNVLENPDEVFRIEDEQEDVLLTYIKAYGKSESSGESYYHYVICLDTDPKKNMDSVHPVLSFPSKCARIYKELQKGIQVAGSIKN